MSFISGVEQRVSGVWGPLSSPLPGTLMKLSDGGVAFGCYFPSAADAIRVNGGTPRTGIPGTGDVRLIIKLDAAGELDWVVSLGEPAFGRMNIASDGDYIYTTNQGATYNADDTVAYTGSGWRVMKLGLDGFWVAEGSTFSFDIFSEASADVGGGVFACTGSATAVTQAVDTTTLAPIWTATHPRGGFVSRAVDDSGNVAVINRTLQILDGATGAALSTKVLSSNSQPIVIGSYVSFHAGELAAILKVGAPVSSQSIVFGADSYTYAPGASEYGIIVGVFNVATDDWLWSSELAVGTTAALDASGVFVHNVQPGKVHALWNRGTADPSYVQQFNATDGTVDWTATIDPSVGLFGWDGDTSGSSWFYIAQPTTYNNSDATTESPATGTNFGNINNAGIFGETSLGAPVVVTDPPSFITIESADLYGTLVSDGGTPPVETRFEVATSPDPADIVIIRYLGVTPVGSFTETVTGLTPATTYYVRAGAENSIGISYGAWIEFTTLAAIPPLVTTGTATDIDFFDADLTGSLIDPGDGTIDIVGFVLGLATDPVLGDPGTIDVIATLDEADDFFGEATGLTPGTTYYWRAYGINSFGAIGYGDTKDFDTDDARPPSFVQITMPDADEENTSVGTAAFETDPMEVGTYVWEVSAQTAEPYTGGTSALLIDANGQTAGTVAITAQDDASQSAEVTFTPETHWFGTVQFSIRVGNTYEFSNWRTTNVTILPVPDGPSVPSGTLPTVDEDSTATFDLTWTDPDDLPPGTLAADDGYSVEIRPVSGGEWRTLTEDAPAVTFAGVTFRLLLYSDTELRATLRVEPLSNYNGPYSASFRIRDDIEDFPQFGPSVDLSGTVTAVPDAPTRPQPARMTTAKVGQDVITTFRTFDPDLSDTSWTFEISAVGAATWGSSLTIPDVGTLTVIDADTSDQQAQVKLTQQAGGATELRYQFDLRVVDSSTLTSPIQTVSGFITPPGASVFLQKLTRDGGATITPLTPLRQVVELNVVDSIEGHGAADVIVATDELRRRADQLGIALVDLLDPGTVELVVAVGGERIFTGPIGDVEWSAVDDTLSISARGLLAYLDDRRIGTNTTSFVNEDISAIVWTLIDETQTLTYGDLGLTDNTTTAGTNLTVDFKEDTRLTDAIRNLSQADGGPEVWVTPDREVSAAPARGSDKRSIIRITAGAMELATWTSRDELLATVVTVVGGDDGAGGFYQGTVVTADTGALDRYGRRERFINRPELTSDAACEAYAQRILDGQARRLENITLTTVVTPERPYSIRDVEVGDIVTVDLRAPDLGQIVGAYRIVNRRLDLVSETADSYRVRLDLVPAPMDGGLVVQVKARHNASVFERLAQLDRQQG